MSVNAAGPCAGCGKTASEAKKMQPARSAAPLAICDACVVECTEAMADNPTRIPGKPRTCSFCRKAEDSVAMIVVLGDQLICDECVDFYRAAL